MPEVKDLANKFGLQKIVEDFKSIISPVVVPEVNRDNPIGYYVSELAKIDQELGELHIKQADLLARANNVLGSLCQELLAKKELSTIPPLLDSVALKAEATPEKPRSK